MNNMIPKKTAFLVPPLPLVEEAKDKDEKPKATSQRHQICVETTSWQYLFSANLQA
jgi:hypothetical protein